MRLLWRVGVSIHAPTRGATHLVVLRPVIYRFQSTHPHGVRPTRAFLSFTSILFQSTHPHGVRRLPFQVDKSISCFNPRTHTGCDLMLRVPQLLIQVSIHAPTRGATPSEQTIVNLVQRFNPRTHTGCDPLKIDGIKMHCSFQSTHPHGVRRNWAVCHLVLYCFNPRTHTGCDGMHTTISALTARFQSTHPHGVRHNGGSQFFFSINGFNPRTHTGCDASWA